MTASIAVVHLALLVLPALSALSSSDDFIFNGFRDAQNLTMDGAASITSDGALQLTTDTNNVTGHVFFSSPVRMLSRSRSGAPRAVSFSTEFVLDIVTMGKSGGHGLAFVVSPTKVFGGDRSGSSLGLLSPEADGNTSNHLFAIEFDTVQNSRLNDTNENHVGVDINSLVSNTSEPTAYYTDDSKKVDLELESAQPILAWVDYDGADKMINVTVAPLSVPRPRKPLISHALDLSPILKENMYVGFSSSTGRKMASLHYILAWSFKTDGVAQDIDLSRLPKVPRASNSSTASSAAIKIAAVSSVSTLVVIAAGIAIFLWLQRRAALAETLEEWELGHPHRFPYKELYKATKGFRDSEVLGAGGFGQVYKGVLRRTGEEVAIKQISSNARQGMREFFAEVASLGRMRHRHIVELRGWCKRDNDLLLVYEFMQNGSLDVHLFGSSSGRDAPPLTWEQRFKILKGVASGLVYLHEEWEQVVVHRDVKASNVLLDADMAAHLGDFGLARLYEHGAHPTTTRLVGTLGYMAPELTVTGRATTATDVFAFGALLLEVACGRRPIEPNGPDIGMHIVSWVRACGLKGQLLNAVDPRLAGCYQKGEMELVLWLGLMCSQPRPEARPTMRQVGHYLNGEERLPEDLALVLSASDAESVDFFGSGVVSLTWSSHGPVSTSSFTTGR